MRSTTETATNISSTKINLTEEYERETGPISTAFLEIYTLLSLACIAANALIAFVVIKYKRLYQEKSNIILLHWAILNSLFMLCSPTTIRLAYAFRFIEADNTFCFVEQLEYTFLLADIFLIILLTIYWYTKLYHPNKFLKFVQHFKFFLSCVYIFSLFFIGVHVDACYNERLNTISEVALFLAYLIYFLFIIIINIAHAIKKRKLPEYSDKNNTPFILTNTFILSYLPALAVIFIGSYLLRVANEITLTVTLLISIMNPIYFFIILYKCDRDYNVFFKHVLSCKCRKYDDELVEQTVTYNNDAENRC